MDDDVGILRIPMQPPEGLSGHRLQRLTPRLRSFGQRGQGPLCAGSARRQRWMLLYYLGLVSHVLDLFDVPTGVPRVRVPPPAEKMNVI